MRYLLVFFVTIASAWAQGGLNPNARAFTEIREFLELTETQIERLEQQNEAFARYTRQRTQRMIAVQRELEVEKTYSPLDPLSLGIRTAEIEALRREISERNLRLIADNVAVLTDAQRAKLKILNDVLAMVATANQGQTLKLIPDDCASPTGIAASSGLGLGLGLCSPILGGLGGRLP